MKKKPIKMSFPNYKKNWLGIRKPDGWQDLGRVESFIDDPKIPFLYSLTHNMCKKKINVGKDHDGIFRFCPLCLVKLNFKEDEK